MKPIEAEMIERLQRERDEALAERDWARQRLQAEKEPPTRPVRPNRFEYAWYILREDFRKRGMDASARMMHRAEVKADSLIALGVVPPIRESDE